MPNMMCAKTFAWPRTRTWRSPNSSLSRALTRSTVDRLLYRIALGSGMFTAARALGSISFSSFNALSRRGLTSMIGTWPLCSPCRCISGASWAESISSWRYVTRPPVIVASGMAARLSCREAEVKRQLTGTSPSAASMCGLQPVHDPRWLFAFRLVPTAQAFGRSRIISSRLMSRCRSRRRSGLSTASPG